MMLTDVVMRGMNVRELAEQARRVDKDVDLLQKPISQAQLSTRIREVLDRR